MIQRKLDNRDCGRSQGQVKTHRDRQKLLDRSIEIEYLKRDEFLAIKFVNDRVGGHLRSRRKCVRNNEEILNFLCGIQLEELDIGRAVRFHILQQIEFPVFQIEFVDDRIGLGIVWNRKNQKFNSTTRISRANAKHSLNSSM